MSLIELKGKELFFHNGVKLGEILAGDDGFKQFWPELRGGYWETYVLRQIADMVDEINAPWEKQIRDFFGDESKTL